MINYVFGFFFLQFDRSGRTKSESLSGLEEVLTCLQPSTFGDDQLSRFRGLCWNDFLAIVQQNRELPKNLNRATKSTLTSTTEEASVTFVPIANTECGSSSPRSVQSAVSRALKPQLVRQSTQQDYSSRIKVLCHLFCFLIFCNLWISNSLFYFDRSGRKRNGLVLALCEQ